MPKQAGKSGGKKPSAKRLGRPAKPPAFGYWVRIFRSAEFPDEVILSVLAPELMPRPGMSARERRRHINKTLNRWQKPVALGAEPIDDHARKEAAFAVRRYEEAETATLEAKERLEGEGRAPSETASYLSLEAEYLSRWDEAIAADEVARVMHLPRVLSHDERQEHISRVTAQAETITKRAALERRQEAQTRMSGLTTSEYGQLPKGERAQLERDLGLDLPTELLEERVKHDEEKPSKSDALSRLSVPYPDRA